MVLWSPYKAQFLKGSSVQKIFGVELEVTEL